MGLYKRKDSHHWWMSFTVNRKRVHESTRTSNRKRAEKRYAKRLMAIEDEGLLPGESIIFREAWGKYMREEVRYKAPVTQMRAEQSAKNFLPEFGDLTLSQITPAILSTYRAKRLEDGVTMSTVVKELQFVRRVFSLAKRDWQYVRQSPFELFRMPAPNDHRVRFLQPGQFEKLLMACPVWLRPMVILARYTGLRRGNILGLTWGQVDLNRGVINIDRTKNGHRLTVPLSETPLKMLLSLKKAKVVRLDCPHVFNEGGKSFSPYQVSMAFKRACKRAGVSDFRFHDLRHDFASNLVQKGNDIYLVQHLLGHSDGRMTQRYAHLRVEQLRKAVETLEGERCYDFVTVGNEKGVTAT